MASFCTRGVGFLNQRSRQKINPLEICYKGAAKTLRGWNPAILRGGADKKWNDPTWDAGRTRFVSHEPKASDLQAFRVLFENPNWFTEPTDHRNVWYIAFE